MPAFPTASRPKWVLACLVVCLALAAGVATMALTRGRARPSPRLERATLAIAPGLHLLAGLGPSAAYAIETQDVIVLIDTGLEADAAALKTQMAAENLDWRSVRAIFLTH